MRFVTRFLLWCFSLGFIAALFGFAALIGLFMYYTKDLPDYASLKDYEPPVVTRVHAGDGRLLAEFAQEKRIFVPITEIPDLVKQAFLSAEDQNFYEHQGVDPKAILRAFIVNIKNVGTDTRLVGGSTITQQVIKNFLLTNERKLERKIREAVLAFRVDKVLSKDRILELYLNEIFLGNRSYGVASAALNYFNKSLDVLSIEEAAYLAALPKAPNNYKPDRHYDRAIARRNWVISRMVEDNYITGSQGSIAQNKPLQVKSKDEDNEAVFAAPYFAEEIRREMVEKYGSDSIYKQGLSIRSTINPDYQAWAEKALREGLEAYDRRHGWRGPLTKTQTIENWKERLQDFETPSGMLDEWNLALVLDRSGKIGLDTGGTATLSSFSQKWGKDLRPGDIVMVAPNEGGIDYALKQIPKVQGALVAIDPRSGRVMAMQGGWAYGTDQYNRATQAERQPGSAFKPFVYLTALLEGYTPSTLVLDAPFEYEDRPGNIWRPKNYSNEFYGPTPIRVGVEKSRNLMTVRLAHHIGMDKIVDVAQEFGIYDTLKPQLANALGAAETTLINMTNAYAMLVNGGQKITPTYIDRIQNRYGQTVLKQDQAKCTQCGPKIQWQNQDVPTVEDMRTTIANQQNIYQIASILEGVVERGTGVRLKSLGRPMAGKTGTTNDSKDAWFVGFSPNLAVGVYVGFDQPKSLGKKETGSSVALPIFKDFMEGILKDTPATPFRVPEGVQLIRVDPKTGRRVSPFSESGIWEAFIKGTRPEDTVLVIDDGVLDAWAPENTLFAPDGIYEDGIYDPFQNDGGTPINRQEQPPRRETPSGTGGLY